MTKPTLVFAIYGIGRMPINICAHYHEVLQLLSKRFQVTVVEVRNEIGEFSNSRSGEKKCLLQDQFFFEHSVKISRDFRDSFHNDVLTLSKRYSDVHKDGYASNSNLIQQLLMLREVVKQVGKLNADFVLCIRDDILFDAEVLAKNCVIGMPPQFFVTSVFHSNCGVCERILFGSVDLVSQLLERLSLVDQFLDVSPRLRYCHTAGLNGEWLMRFAVEQYKCSPVCIPLFTKRYRANGVFAKERLSLRPKYLIHETPSLVGFFRYFRLMSTSFGGNQNVGN
mgnify:CR=1 FL=1